MKKYKLKDLVDNGTHARKKIDSDVIIGDVSNGYGVGDILDANAVSHLVQTAADGVLSGIVVEEKVNIVVTSEVEGFNAEGLVINVYYNNSPNVSTTVTLDENGRGVLAVPHDYKYKMVFPSINGYKDPAPVIHYSTLTQRSVEIEYSEPDEYSAGMQLTVFAAKANKTGRTGTAVPDLDINVTIGGTTTVYTTGSNGRILVVIPNGETATVEVPILEGYEMRGPRSRTFSATQASKYVQFMYYVAESGIKIVTGDGTEYSEEDFEEAVENNEVSTSDAKLIKISTASLITANSIFYVSIDNLATRSGFTSKTWAGTRIKFYDIPDEGNSITAAYYYDGRTASGLIQDEGDRRTISTPAVDEALSKTFALDNDTLYGFLGSVGQWSILWENRYQVDTILSLTRPSANYNFSTYIARKWTSTQGTGDGFSYDWGDQAYRNGTLDSFAVIPFFAF